MAVYESKCEKGTTASITGTLTRSTALLHDQFSILNQVDDRKDLSTFLTNINGRTVCSMYMQIEPDTTDDEACKILGKSATVLVQHRRQEVITLS